jgi:molecular chaperone HscC
MPVVRRAVTRMFGRFPAITVNPDEAVALGAAVMAGLKSRDEAIREVVMTDVCPYTLGVDSCARLPDGSVKSGLFSPVIERNTVVPASRVRTFRTLEAGQKTVVFKVLQGESRHVSENLQIGEIDIPMPPKSPAGTQLECRFSYDINGLIEVDLHVPVSGERRQLVIVDEDEGPGGDDLIKLREALAAIKIHPREAGPNRSALARASRLYETTLGATREWVGLLISEFETVLDRQDPRAIEPARMSLLKSLDTLEGETFL